MINLYGVIQWQNGFLYDVDGKLFFTEEAAREYGKRFCDGYETDSDSYAMETKDTVWRVRRFELNGDKAK